MIEQIIVWCIVIFIACKLDFQIPIFVSVSNQIIIILDIVLECFEVERKTHVYILVLFIKKEYIMTTLSWCKLEPDHSM